MAENKELGEMKGRFLLFLAAGTAALIFAARCSPVVNYTIDIYITSPHDGDTVSGDVTIQTVVSGTDDIQFVTFTVDGEVIANVDAPPFELVWNTEDVTDGWHYLRAEAHGAHITDYSDTVSVYVKNHYGIDAPSEVNLSSEDEGLDVRITWSKVDTADGYILQYRMLGDSIWILIAATRSADDTTFVHDPELHTGFYRVISVKDSFESRPSETVSTVPIATDTLMLREVNLGGHAGYGWDRADGTGHTYSMIYPINAEVVDFYFTNFGTDYSTPPFYIASPAYSQLSSDSVIVPPSTWRDNGIQWVSRDTAAFLLPQSGYRSHEELAEGAFYGLQTQDGFYALIYIDDIDTTSGTLKVRTWFQKVQGLRLFER